MPKFVLICGPQAVGKMTVGQELTKITDLKLFHNHMTIEMLLPIFEHKTKEFKELNKMFRNQVFEKFANSDQYGLIFTFIWDFDRREDWEYVESVIKTFEDKGGDTYIVELEAELEQRVERNKTENRLLNKPTKRNLEWSHNELLRCMEDHRMNSNEGEVQHKNYLRINNTNLSPQQVAKIIKEKFEL